MALAKLAEDDRLITTNTNMSDKSETRRTCIVVVEETASVL